MCYDVLGEIEGKEASYFSIILTGKDVGRWERGLNGLFRIKKDFDWGYDFLMMSNYDGFNE